MTRLQQVFTNLVKNAIKFTPPGGTVAIETRDAGEGSVSVSVSDNGLGIEPHALPRIFDAFEQGGTDITRLFGGLGLGLSISKALVDLHGGTIHVHSDGRGKGAVFTVVLPVAEALVRRPDPPPAANRATPAECRILLLEDHLDTARALARLLSMEGHRVQTANTIAAAVAAMAAQPYDLLISDLQLPDGSGLDFMRQVRERFPVAGIALSGYGSATDVEQSLRAGFVEHLTKPVNIGQLNDAICRVRARQAGDVT